MRSEAEIREYAGRCVARAMEWARRAGELQLRYFRSAHLAMATKQNAYDVVTEADKASENLLKECIATEFPDHDILSEESGASGSGEAEWRWVIDPLDGTTNFSQGLPVFCISIALQHREETVGGVVFAPYLGEMFDSVKGGGARLNGHPICCAGRKRMAEMVMATGMPYDKNENPDNNLKYITSLAPRLRGLRRLGAAALDLCYTAAGFFDAYWELNLNPWDVEAGMLMVREAGGFTELLRGHRGVSVAAGSESGLRELIAAAQF